MTTVSLLQVLEPPPPQEQLLRQQLSSQQGEMLSSRCEEPQVEAAEPDSGLSSVRRTWSL